MGYCYDVALTIDQASNKKLREELQSASESLKKMFAEECDCSLVDPKTNIALYHWDYSKWSEEETEFINSYIETLDEEQYRYVRLGESNGDLEEYGQLGDDPFDARIDAKIIYNKSVNS